MRFFIVIFVLCTGITFAADKTNCPSVELETFLPKIPVTEATLPKTAESLITVIKSLSDATRASNETLAEQEAHLQTTGPELIQQLAVKKGSLDDDEVVWAKVALRNLQEDITTDIKVSALIGCAAKTAIAISEKTPARTREAMEELQRRTAGLVRFFAYRLGTLEGVRNPAIGVSDLTEAIKIKSYRALAQVQSLIQGTEQSLSKGRVSFVAADGCETAIADSREKFISSWTLSDPDEKRAASLERALWRVSATSAIAAQFTVTMAEQAGVTNQLRRLNCLTVHAMVQARKAHVPSKLSPIADALGVESGEIVKKVWEGYSDLEKVYRSVASPIGMSREPQLEGQSLEALRALKPVTDEYRRLELFFSPKLRTDL